MIEVKATNTRKKFMCSSKDKIMDNGNCYQLITQFFREDWCNISPVISKTEFKRLMKLGVLGEPYKQKMIFEVTMYDFIDDVEEQNDFSNEQATCIERLEKENLYYKDVIETNTAEWEEQGHRVVELEKEISILLSCKDCPNNKGGYICQKEYEDKCLAQKIQYIKELQEENAKLDCQKNRNKSCYSCANATERCFRNEIGCPCEKYKSYKEENAELEKKLLQERENYWSKGFNYSKDKLEKELDKYKEMVEDMKDDMCGTSDTTLYNYLITILKKYGEIV